MVLNIDKFKLEFMNKQFLAVTSILFLVFILLMNLGYNAYYFFRQWQKSVEEKAKLEVDAESAAKERAVMQYQHLKNQVNPHFLFNTLTSLDGLILSEPEVASQFVKHLSKVYRYVLEHRENEIVPLQTEIDFIKHYISVLKIKHNGALEIVMNISPSAREKRIAMVTLQMLIDNAIKHNAVHEKSPLTITINDDGDVLAIHNNKQPRKQIDNSTKHGLKHLQQLYSFLSPTPVVIEDVAASFTIKLPLL
jgi:LytS/YehU family sensor histidine kinase